MEDGADWEEKNSEATTKSKTDEKMMGREIRSQSE